MKKEGKKATPQYDRIKGKIVEVITAQAEGVNGDSVIVRFDFNGATRDEDFGSPLLDAANIAMWRQLVASVVTGIAVKSTDKCIKDFAEYKKMLEKKDVYVCFNGRDVFAIGKEPQKMFSPHAYGLWDTD